MKPSSTQLIVPDQTEIRRGAKSSMRFTQLLHYTMKPIRQAFVYGALLAVASVVMRGQVSSVIFQDTFADAERTTQNLPNSVAWYHTSLSPANLAAKNGVLDLVVANNARSVWAYFPTVNLQVGESLTFTLYFRLTAAPIDKSSGFRVGLCYSNGNGPRAQDLAGELSGNYQGYGSFTNLARQSAATSLYKRSGSAAPQTILLGTVGDSAAPVWLPFGNGSMGLTGPSQANVLYSCVLRVARTGPDSADVTSSFSGGGLNESNRMTHSDPSGIFASFDTVSFRFATDALDGDMLIAKAELVADLHPRDTTLPPAVTTAKPGATATFAVAASGANAPTFQWQRKPANSSVWSNLANLSGYSGVTTSMLTVGAVTVTMDGDQFRCVITSRTGETVSSVSTLVVDTARLANLSVRSNAGSGSDTLIVGFAVGGSGSKQVLLRAVGPGLAVFGVGGVLADPRLDLFDGAGRPNSQNDDWGGGATQSRLFTSVGAFALPPNSKDAALAVTVVPGSYSAQTQGAGGATGVALVEAYDADGAAPSSRLVNLSARNRVGTGGDILIAGFVITGNSSKPLLIRAVGPTLGAFGVPDTLADPKLELYGTTLLQANDNWGGGAQLRAAFTSVGAFALPADSRDAAMVATLPPGSYTVQVSGVGGTTGVALVEVYELP